MAERRALRPALTKAITLYLLECFAVFDSRVLLVGLALIAVGCENPRREFEINDQSTKLPGVEKEIREPLASPGDDGSKQIKAQRAADLARCEQLYPPFRKPVVARVKCINEVHVKGLKGDPNLDLWTAMANEFVVLAEKYDAGKLTQAQYAAAESRTMSEYRTRALQPQRTADLARCEQLYPPFRKPVVARVKCINEANMKTVDKNDPYLDLLRVMATQYVVLAEQYDAGKMTEAQYEAAVSKVASDYRTRALQRQNSAAR